MKKKFINILVLVTACLFMVSNVYALETTPSDTDLTEEKPETPSNTNENGQTSQTPSDSNENNQTSETPTDSNKDEQISKEPTDSENNETTSKAEDVSQEELTNNTSTTTPSKKNTAREVDTTPKTKNTKSLKAGKLTVINISKSKKETIVGSKFKLLDEDDNVIAEWTTTKDAYSIDDLKKGKYYLIQTEVSGEYELNAERLEIEMTSDPLEISFENEISSKLTSVLSSDALLISVAMFDIAMGLGIGSYVKKNKK